MLPLLLLLLSGLLQVEDVRSMWQHAATISKESNRWKHAGPWWTDGVTHAADWKGNAKFSPFMTKCSHIQLRVYASNQWRTLTYAHSLDMSPHEIFVANTQMDVAGLTLQNHLDLFNNEAVVDPHSVQNQLLRPLCMMRGA